MSMVDYSEFDENKMTALTPEPKTYGEGATKGSYCEMKFQYNYGTPQKPLTDGLFFQWPKVWINGIRSQPKKEKPEIIEHSVMLSLDLKKPEDQMCMNVIQNKVYNKMANFVHQHRVALKVPLFSIQAAEATGLKGLLYFQRDNGEIIAGKNPTTFIKLNDGFNNRTSFIRPDGEPISWEILKQCKFLCIPCIHYSHIYAGGKGANPQVKLSSAVVYEVQPLDQNDRQAETLKKSDPSSVDKLEQQIQALMKKKKDLESGVTTSTPVSKPVTSYTPQVSQPTVNLSTNVTPSPNTSTYVSPSPINMTAPAPTYSSPSIPTTQANMYPISQPPVSTPTSTSSIPISVMPQTPIQTPTMPSIPVTTQSAPSYTPEQLYQMQQQFQQYQQQQQMNQNQPSVPFNTSVPAPQPPMQVRTPPIILQ